MLHLAPLRTPSRTTKRCSSSLATWCSSPRPSLWRPCALSSTTSLRFAAMPLSSAPVCRDPLESEWRALASGRSESEKLIQAHEVSPKHRGFETIAVMSPCVINSGFVSILEVNLSRKCTCDQLPLCGWNNWTEQNEANIKVIFLFSPLTDCDGGHGPDCHHRELLPDWSVWSAAATLPVAQPWDGHHLHRHPRGTTARPC